MFSILVKPLGKENVRHHIKEKNNARLKPSLIFFYLRALDFLLEIIKEKERMASTQQTIGEAVKLGVHNYQEHPKSKVR